MSYLSPVDSAQVYFDPLDVDDAERPRCGEDRDGLEDMRERFERLDDPREDARERFRTRDFDADDRYRDRDDRYRDRDDRCGDRDDQVRFERFELERPADPQGRRPLPRL